MADVDAFAASIGRLTDGQIDAVVEAYRRWQRREDVRSMTRLVVAASLRRPDGEQRAETPMLAAANDAVDAAVKARMARYGGRAASDHDVDIGHRLQSAAGSVVDALLWRSMLMEREFRLWTWFWADGTGHTPLWEQD